MGPAILAAIEFFKKLYDEFVALTTSRPEKSYKYVLYITVMCSSPNSPYTRFIASRVTKQPNIKIPALGPINSVVKFSKADATTFTATLDVSVEDLPEVLNILNTLKFSNDVLSTRDTHGDI